MFRLKAHGPVIQQFHSSADISKWLNSWIAPIDDYFYLDCVRGLPERWEEFSFGMRIILIISFVIPFSQ